MKKAKIIKIGGSTYEDALFRVNTRREDGTPDQCTLVKDPDTVELSENEDENCFFSAYILKIDHTKDAGKIPTI